MENPNNLSAVEWYSEEHWKLFLQLESKELTPSQYTGEHQILLEEAKQMEKEKLEEAAHKMLDDYGIKSMGQTIGVLKVKELMVNFAKWQQEQDKNKYSEEDMKEAFNQGQENIDYHEIHGFSAKLTTNEWFEQLKQMRL
jgi:hypothetical protein